MRVPDIFRVAIGAALGIITIGQVDFAVAHEAIGRQGGKKTLRRSGFFVAFSTDSGETESLNRRLGIIDLPDIVGCMAVLALRGGLQAAIEDQAMGCFFIGFPLIGVAGGASGFCKPFCRMKFGLGFLVAIRASHSGRSMGRGLEGFLVDIERKERTVFGPLAQPGIIMALPALGIFRGLDRRGPEQKKSKERESDPAEGPPSAPLPCEHFIRRPFLPAYRAKSFNQNLHRRARANPTPFPLWPPRLSLPSMVSLRGFHGLNH